MNTKSLAQIGLALATGYPSKDTERVAVELEHVVEAAMPSLARRASSTINQGKVQIEEVWRAIREGSEELFAPALKDVERVKVIYVASKFVNNKAIGELMTRAAIELARSQKED